MVNQWFKAPERKYQVLPYFGICDKELSSKLRVFAHACTVSALPVRPSLK